MQIWFDDALAGLRAWSPAWIRATFFETARYVARSHTTSGQFDR